MLRALYTDYIYEGAKPSKGKEGSPDPIDVLWDSRDRRAILSFVEEAILVDAFLKGEGMDPIDALFAFFANYPTIMNSPLDWLPVYAPWIILVLIVIYVFGFGRLIAIVALVIAYVSGTLFPSDLSPSEAGLLVAMGLGAWAVYRHVYHDATPWWL